MISDYFNIALKNAKKRKLRSFLTLLGILISIATLFVLISLSLGLEATIQEQFQKLGTDKFFIQPLGQFGPPGASTAAMLTTEDIDVIKKVAGVKDVTGYTIGNVKIKFKDTLKFGMAVGMDPEKVNVAFGSYKLDSGRYPRKSSNNEVVLGSQYKYNDFLGQSVNIGNTVLIDDVEFKVVGFVEPLGNPQDDRQIYLSEDAFRTLLDIPTRVDMIVVQVSDTNEMNDVADRVERKLMKSRDVTAKTKDFTVLTPEELLGSVKIVLNLVTYFLFGIAAISLFVGAINIANAMFTSVLERTREIGVMKAIGAQNKDILAIFVIESGLLGLVGGVLGIALGAGIGKAIEYIAINYLSTNLLKVVFPWYLIAGSLAFAFVVGAASGIWPAWRATKIKPVEALRYE
jgi:putative ABC transport system permease protein